MRRKRTLSVLLLIIGLAGKSCIPNSDFTEELSGDYFYRGEGGTINDILSHKANKKVIPANVIAYEYNDDFIVAKQKLNKTDDPLYETKFTYPQGRDQLYYWIIKHSENLVIGPLSKKEFELAFDKYNVPQNLRIN